MRKSTKGALAAGAAAVVLLGGAGSLAYWTAEGDVTGTTITAGELKLGTATCTGWSYVNDAGDPVAGSISEIVPGDAITETCSFTITAVGDHLSATATTPDAVSPATYTDDGGTQAQTGSTLSLPVSTEYHLGTAGNASDAVFDASATRITEADDGKKLTAVITVAFPYGNTTTVNANDTQNLSAALDDLTVSLAQDETTGVNDNG